MDNYHECNKKFYERASKLINGMEEKGQAKRGELIGIAQSFISELQNYDENIAFKESKRQPSAETVYKIAKYFNVSTDYLLGLTDVQTTNTATKELCASLGLSEEAVKILSSDESSIIAKQWEALLLTEPLVEEGETEEEIAELRYGEKMLMIDSVASSIAYTLNKLIDEFVIAHTNSMKNLPEYAERSLLELMERFYHCLDAENYGYHQNGDFLTIGDGMIWGYTKKGEHILSTKGVKELMIDSSIGEISTRLNLIKYRTLGGDKQ